MGEAFRENIKGRVEEQLGALIGDEGLKGYERAPGERQKGTRVTRDDTLDGEWEEKQEKRRCGECTRQKEEEKEIRRKAGLISAEEACEEGTNSGGMIQQTEFARDDWRRCKRWQEVKAHVLETWPRHTRHGR